MKPRDILYATSPGAGCPAGIVMAWLIFLDDVLAGVYRVVPPTGTDLAHCRDLQAGYADLALGIVDASVVALTERLGEPKIATLDQRHFRAVRPAHVGAFGLRP